MAERKAYPLRIDAAVFDAVARWAADDLRSVNAQIEFALRKALAQAGRLPSAKDRGVENSAGSVEEPTPSLPADAALRAPDAKADSQPD